MYRIIIFLFIMSFSVVTNAVENICNDKSGDFRVVFVNGVLTTLTQSLRASREVELAYGNSHQGQNVYYDVAYNSTNVGGLVDFFQAYKQLGYQSERDFWDWLNGTVDFLVPDAFIELKKQYLTIESISVAPGVADHAAKYREMIWQGQKILALSHSQGNFYSNETVILLKTVKPTPPLNGFGVFSVATPANNVGGNYSPYLTNHRDIISLIPGSLSENFTLKSSATGEVEDDVSRVDAHGFLETYLHPKYNVREALKSRLGSALSTLTDPVQVAGSGPVTITMTWSHNESDVDLHVYEPDGSHVYYDSMSGTSGFLDVDNTDGYGPEHYYTDCNQLQIGEYSVGLNYFSDHIALIDEQPTRPVKVTTVISVPGASRTIYTTLTNYREEEGDSTPQSIAKIRVESFITEGGERLTFYIDPE